VAGQFVGRQTVLSAAILCALAAWFGVSADLRVNPRVAVIGLVLAPIGLSATIASTWIGSGRWDDLARFPLRRDELARATHIVANAVILLEAVAPITLFVLLHPRLRRIPTPLEGDATNSDVPTQDAGHDR